MAKEIILADWLMKKLPLAERFHEILRFLIVGGGCFLLEYVLLYMLTEFAGIPYLTSSAIAFLISLLVNYLLCVTVVFHTGKRTKMEMFLFFATSAAGLGINQMTMWFFVEIAGLWYMFAKVIASGIVMIWNYATKRYILKGKVYERHIFTKKEEWFKNKAFTKEVKELFTNTINCYVKEESEKLSVFQQGGVYLAMKKIGKNNPKAEEIKADNAARQEWNRTVDVALVEGVPEEDILKIKQEKITDETLQSIRTHGWLPDMFRQIIRGAKDFLQEVIFKFKLPPRTVPKIDLQEWKDMQKLMYELQGQSREIKRTQQDISSLKKQLSQLRGLFKGKERKSLEGRIELLEDLEKRLHRSMGRIVKREGYPNVQSFQKVYNKAEELIMEYNEELRAWKNQTKPKKENPLEQPQKASVLEKLHRYQQEGRQQPKRSVKKKSMDRER